MLTSGLFTSTTDDWATPQDLFDQLDKTFHFTLDVCASADNAKCKRYFTSERDGLKQNWGGLLFGAIRHTAGKLGNGCRNAPNTSEWQLC